MTDNAIPYDFETWWALFEGLQASPWEEDDIADANIWLPSGSPNAVHAARAMQYVYQQAKEWEGPVDPEGAVAAVLVATYKFHASNTWTPLQVQEMADHFAIYHREMEDPLQDRLDEEYSRMPLEWLSDHGRHELQLEICKDSEIWIDQGGPTGVWVFYKPGRTP